MKKIKIFIADNQQLIVAGLRSILNNKDFEVVGDVENLNGLIDSLEKTSPDILIIDYTADSFDIQTIKTITEAFSNIKILAMTSLPVKSLIKGALSAGVKSYLLKSCDKDEIFEALKTTYKGESFYCSKVLNEMMQESDKVIPVKEFPLNCDGVAISERECEIITLIAEGFSNKEIADKLFLSPHTVNTHRKNIMSKLGVNNASGIVLYAVKEQLVSPK